MVDDILFVDQKTRNLITEQFNKTPNQLEDNVNSLTEWVKTQPHFPEIMGDN